MKLELTQAERGNNLLIHAGDCAETFEDAIVDSWDRKVSRSLCRLRCGIASIK